MFTKRCGVVSSSIEAGSLETKDTDALEVTGDLGVSGLKPSVEEKAESVERRSFEPFQSIWIERGD